MKLQAKATLVFKNKEGKKLEIETTLLDLLNRNLEEFYLDLEPECSSASCNNESQNFCDCGAVYDDYVIDEVVFDVKPSSLQLPTRIEIDSEIVDVLGRYRLGAKPTPKREELIEIEKGFRICIEWLRSR